MESIWNKIKTMCKQLNNIYMLFIYFLNVFFLQINFASCISVSTLCFSHRLPSCFCANKPTCRPKCCLYNTGDFLTSNV